LKSQNIDVLSLVRMDEVCFVSDKAKNDPNKGLAVSCLSLVA
jgi:hypothetical protein